MTAQIHVAGETITWSGRYMRQRCSWCGATLLDYDLARIAVPEGQDPTPGHWPTGALVLVDGQYSTVVELAEGEPVPPESCMHLDPAVTR